MSDLDAADLNGFFGTDMFTDDAPKKPRPGGKKRPAARRKPSRPRTNLDLLMDDVDVDTVPTQNDFDIPKRAVVQHPTLSSNLDRVERNVSLYLEKSIELCSYDFVTSLKQMFMDDDPFEQIVPRFIEEMRPILREAIAIRTDIREDRLPGLSLFDDFAPAFLSTFEQVTHIVNTNHGEQARTVRALTTAVASRKQMVSTEVSNAAGTLKRELIELNGLRTSSSKAIVEMRQKRVSLQKQTRAFERRKCLIDAQSTLARESLDSVRDLVQRSTMMRLQEETMEDVPDSIRKVILNVRSITSKMERCELRRFVLDDVTRSREENQTLRQAVSGRIHALITNARSVERTYGFSDYKESSIVSPARFSPEDDTASHLSNRLRQIQDKRDADLAELADFLGRVQERAGRPARHV